VGHSPGFFFILVDNNTVEIIYEYSAPSPVAS
jgi:hypothetical protein